MDVCDKSGLETLLLTAIPAKNTAFCSALLLFLVWLYEADYFSAFINSMCSKFSDTWFCANIPNSFPMKSCSSEEPCNICIFKLHTSNVWSITQVFFPSLVSPKITYWKGRKFCICTTGLIFRSQGPGIQCHKSSPGTRRNNKLRFRKNRDAVDNFSCPSWVFFWGTESSFSTKSWQRDFKYFCASSFSTKSWQRF